MNKETVPLVDGWKIGETTHKEVVLRAPDAGDIMDANTAAEQPVRTGEGTELVASPMRISMELLCRQIERVGSYDGVVTMELLRRLSTIDLSLVQQASARLDETDNARLQKVLNERGRSEAPADGD